MNFTSDVVKDGWGCYTFKNGNIYEGSWENNQRHGWGRMLYCVNTNQLDHFIETYEGTWVRGKKNGPGRYVWTNGDIYEGEFQDGRREGNGTLVAINADRFEGEWKDGQLHGYGRTVRAKGTIIFEGEFVNGEKEGMGIIVFENGSIYEGFIFFLTFLPTLGTWKDGNKHGFGRETSPDGETSSVEYVKGKKQNEQIVISKDQALSLDWEEAVDRERIRERKERRKKIINGTITNPPNKKKRKKPAFVMPSDGVLLSYKGGFK